MGAGLPSLALKPVGSKGDAAVGDTQHQHQGGQSSGYCTLAWWPWVSRLLCVLLMSSSLLAPGWVVGRCVEVLSTRKEEARSRLNSVSALAGTGVHSQTYFVQSDGSMVRM